MTSLKIEVNRCPECGFTARHESAFYGGKRRLWPTLVGIGLLGMAFFLASWPLGKKTGYLALMPQTMQLKYWPEWRLAARELGSDGRKDWEGLLVRTDLLHVEPDAKARTKLMFRTCMNELVDRPVASDIARDAAVLLSMLKLNIYSDVEREFITDDDLEIMLRSNQEPARRVAIEQLRLQPDRSKELRRLALESYANSPDLRHAVACVFEADKRDNFVVFDEIFGNSQHSFLINASYCLEHNARTDDASRAFFKYWIMNGPPETQKQLVYAIGTRTWDYHSSDQSQRLGLNMPDPALTKEMIGMLFDVLERPEVDKDVAEAVIGKLGRAPGPVVEMTLKRLEQQNSEQIAISLVRLLGFQGSQARSALPVLERYREESRWSRQFQTELQRAIKAIEYVKPDRTVPPPMVCRTG